MYYYQYSSIDYSKQNDISNNYIDNTCLICLDNDDNDITNKILTLKEYSLSKKIIKVCLCNSFFHQKCLELWLTTKKYCPICRSDINEYRLQQITRSTSFQWEELLIIEDNQIRNNIYSSRVLRFIIFISSINVFYIIMYLILSQSKNN